MMRTSKSGDPENDRRNDEWMDEALRLLANPRLPEGLEERLQHRVRIRQAGSGRRTESHRVSTFMRSMWIAIPLTAAAALVMVVMSHRQSDSGKSEPAMTARLASPAPAAASRSPAASPHDPILAKEHVVPSRRVAGERISGTKQKRAALPQTPTQEISFPAPAAPLTEQEKLLLAMARRGEVSSRPELAALLISEPVVQHGLAPEPPLLASPTTSE